jgi:hypothetical protein
MGGLPRGRLVVVVIVADSPSASFLGGLPIRGLILGAVATSLPTGFLKGLPRELFVVMVAVADSIPLLMAAESDLMAFAAACRNALVACTIGRSFASIFSIRIRWKRCWVHQTQTENLKQKITSSKFGRIRVQDGFLSIHVLNMW